MVPPGKKPTPPRHVVAVPYPGRGHINPMLNLCKAVAGRSTDIHITFVVTEEWLGLIGSTNKPPNFSFAAVPNVVPSETVRGDDPYGFFMAVLNNMVDPFEKLLRRIPPPDLVVADAFLPWAGESAGSRNIPMAYLWTMSASMYAVFNNSDLLAHNGHFPIDLSVNGDAIVDYIPGLSPIRVADLPSIMRSQEKASIFLDILPSKSKYTNHLMIFTSIQELESQVFNALKQQSPFPIYNIGPITSYSKLRKNTIEDEDSSTNPDDINYSEWLDLQPPSSVLYVSLGSFLSVSSAQLDEIATGLLSSGVRFLWVARREMGRLKDLCGGDQSKGLVVAWCDQLRVLRHPAIGGFWSHCGWSSTKETAMAGVPVLASPILMDQSVNAKAIVEDWRMGWRVIKGEFDEGNLVKGDEIAELVQRFMDLESMERQELSRNAERLKSVCDREFASGQSYETNLDSFVEAILQCTTTAL